MTLPETELAKLDNANLNVLVAGGSPNVVTAALDELHARAYAEDRHRRNTETGCYRTAAAIRGEAWIRKVFPQRPNPFS
ncbi:hypothetical protein VA596_41590 [Amycolatopsis sp., V23-08]|uniref:Uncharacterized protein n=1 Tax=Amycolatopsis heterodermiae TaxID=3110235 RepID=A0ABU5RJS9_9PSEU|nr:hypothetical protein [Amycolatopsis sp., V23-08]MEA5366080.1 hypothetical protein [Amycolatopsis sp., V23-08]